MEHEASDGRAKAAATAVIAIASTITGEFLYQAMGDHLWEVAAERSYFGVFGIVTYLCVSWASRLFR